MLPIGGLPETMAGTSSNVQPEFPTHQGLQTLEPELQGRSRCVALYKERKRRRDFKDLFDTLISLVPGHTLEDNRTLSDQLSSARDYISFLERRIAELKAERNTMKMCSGHLESDGVVMRQVAQSRWEVSVMVSDAQILKSEILLVFQSHGFDIEGAHSYAISDVRSLHTFLIKGEAEQTRSTEDALLQLLNKE